MRYIENFQFINKRKRMVLEQIVRRDINNYNLINAMLEVPRHIFVPEEVIEYAYNDCPLPIGYKQTISQPYIVALMIEKLNPKPGEKILEIGTGSGYLAAILHRMGCHVYTVEIIEPLGKKARMTLKSIGYDDISCKIGDGYQGWGEYAPFDKIILSAAPSEIPKPLLDQLVVNGKIIMPLEDKRQELKLITKKTDELEITEIASVLFVPMTGEIEKKEKHSQ